MKLSFHGAARSITGSRHMVELPGCRLLLDCGLFQGRREEAFEQNRDVGFDPKSVNAVLLSHAHVDHSGALPVLPRHGFSGKAFLTRATADLTQLMMEDSANVIVFVGFQAEHTLGRKLVEGWDVVPIFGVPTPRRAQVVTFNGLSAHADRNDLLAYVRAINPAPAKIFIVQGEEKQALSLGTTIHTEYPGNAVEISRRGSSYDA